MTRTPRANDKVRDLLGRRPVGLARKAVAYAGAGVALTGIGTVAAVTGLTGTPAANAAQPASVSRTIGSVVRTTPAAHTTAAKRTARAKHTAPRGRKAQPKATAQHTAPASTHKKSHAKHATTWSAVQRLVAERTYPKATGHGPLPAQDQLTPAGLTGPQTYLPMTSDRYDNAKAIVRAALDRHMGLRSAVIAVATAMQESGLVNVNYGTSDSLGLFQQRPSCGWGTAAQIMHPSYAANAFLSALHGYQLRTPGWARDPMWQTAQGVQASGYPTAYAKWEAQAASVVASITKRLV